VIDSERFEELYREYWSLVFTLCQTRLGDVEEAEDAALEVFLRKWQAIDRYDPQKATFKTWLSRNAEHRCIDLLRQRQRQAEAEKKHRSDPPRPPMDSEDRIVIRDCLKTLDPTDRQLVLMHEVEGYTWEEMAADTGLTVSQVRTRTARAKEQLRQGLEEQGVTHL
jgi:RNA polymerase sigma-70 factor (ECF subfamily)